MADGPNVYTDNAGVIVVRASAFGSCERKLWASYDGVQPMEHKDTTKRAFKEGHLHEDALVEQRTQEGYTISDDQAEVVLKILPNKLHIVGHIDGVINDPDAMESRLWEAKSMSRAAFDDWVVGRWDYRPGYKWQLAIYMLGMGLDKAWYDVKRRDDGFIDTWLIDELPYSKAEIRSRALMLYKMFKSGDMPDCTGEGGAKWFCEYWFLHDEEPISIDSAPDDEPIDNVPELDELMGAYYETVNTEAWARKERARIKAEIQEKFLAGRDVIRTEHHVLKINDGTSSRFDKAAMSAELGQEVVDRFTKKTPTKVWKIDTREG